MNPIFASEEPLAEPLEEIVLELSDFQRAHIVIAIVDSEVLVHEAMAELGQRLSGRCTLYEFDFRCPPHKSLPRFCRSLAKQHPFCVFAYGLEKSQKKTQAKGKQTNKRAESAYDEALAFLNMHREDIALSKAAVVLWVPPVVHADLLSKAGDFWAWRTAEVRFEPSPSIAIRPTTLGKISLEDAEDLRRQALQIEDILSRPYQPNPAVMADLQRQLSALLKQLGQEEESEALQAQATLALATLGDEQRLKELYCQHVIDRFGKLTLYSISSDAPLSVDLEQVFVKLTAIQRQQRTREVPGMRDIADPGQRKLRSRLPEDAELDEFSTFRQEEVSVTLSISEALAAHHNLTIIGAPGSGKTTLLRYLALTFARQDAGERLSLDEDRLPLLITLRDFSRFLDNLKQNGNLLDLGPQLLPQFLNQHTQATARHLNLPDDFFSRQLDTHNCMVLFDGLDEVADPMKRGRAAEAIATCVRQYRGNRFVISSRPRGYEGEARQRLAALCTDCTIRDFDDEDMQAFATNWYTAVTRERLGDNLNTQAEAQRQAEDLLRAIRADERVKSLAHNPLLLSVLAMVHQRGVGLPQRRAELYDECTDMLLGYWDQVKGGEAARELASYGELDRSEKRTLLEPIALWFHERGEQGVEAEKEELEQEIARHFQDIFGDEQARARRRAASFLKVIEERAGLLVERETGVYAFAHLTFQEYLAARAIADREDYIDDTLQHLHNPWWREVILLEVGHLSDVRHFGRRAQRFTTNLIKAIRDANSPLEDILKRDLLFAARALADVGPLGINENLRHNILDEILVLQYETPYTPQRSEVAELLSYAAPTVSGEYICEKIFPRLKDPDAKVRRVTAETFGHLGERAATEPVLTTLLTYLKDPDANVRQATALALGRLGERAATEPVLTTLLTCLKDPDANVRWVTARTFGHLGDRAATEPVLTTLLTCLKDPDASVRQATAETFGQLGDRAATEPVLTTLLTYLKDSDASVRQATAETFGQLGDRAAPEPVLTTLLTCLKDPDASVRQAAAKTFGQLGDRAATEPVLTTLFSYLKDPDASVRRATALALGQLGERAETAEISAQLVELWQSQLQETKHEFFGNRYERICDIAYEELRRIAGHPAFSQTV